MFVPFVQWDKKLMGNYGSSVLVIGEPSRSMTDDSGRNEKAFSNYGRVEITPSNPNRSRTCGRRKNQKIDPSHINPLEKRRTLVSTSANVWDIQFSRISSKRTTSELVARIIYIPINQQSQPHKKPSLSTSKTQVPS